MLRLGRSSLSNKAGSTADQENENVQAALATALAGRDRAEQSLEEEKAAKRALELKVAQLEGGPAQRAVARAVAKAEDGAYKLTSAQEVAAHEQAMLKDALGEANREAELVRFRLRQAEHSASQREEQARAPAPA